MIHDDKQLTTDLPLQPNKDVPFFHSILTRASEPISLHYTEM